MTEKEIKYTEADKIWEEIKNRSIELYSLPNQTVENHVEKLPIPGDKLFVKLKATGVVTALEYALGNKYIINVDNKYTTITRAESDPDEIEKVLVSDKANKLRTKLNK